MNSQKVYHNVQERIALENFKKETRKARCRKNRFLAISLVAFLLAYLLRKKQEN